MRGLILIIFLFTASWAASQDIRSGEITIHAISNTVMQATLVLYSDTTNAVNRPYIVLSWGDATRDTLLTTSPTIVNGVYKFQYQKTHQYNGNGNM